MQAVNHAPVRENENTIEEQVMEQVDSHAPVQVSLVFRDGIALKYKISCQVGQQQQENQQNQ